MSTNDIGLLNAKIDDFETKVTLKINETNDSLLEIKNAILGNLATNSMGVLERSRNFEKEIETLKLWKEEAKKQLEDYREFRQNYKKNMKLAVLILTACASLGWALLKSIVAYYYGKLTGQH